jgi:hypothetical protein
MDGGIEVGAAVFRGTDGIGRIIISLGRFAFGIRMDLKIPEVVWPV